MTRIIRFITFYAITNVLLIGCSSNPTKDSLESINRPIYSFNHGVDTVLYKPFASMYDAALPNPIEKGVSNAFDNIAEPSIIINNLLQFRIGNALEDTWRLIFNSTIGVGGLYDPAAYFGLKKNYQDLGLTFSRWGIKTPYFVIPFIGPSTLSDAVGFIVNYEVFMIYPYIESNLLKYSLVGLDIIRLRAELLPTDQLVEQAFDPYIFVRDAYTQKRTYLLNPEQKVNDSYIEEKGISGTLPR